MRFLLPRAGMRATVLLLVAAAVAGYDLRRQYGPGACLGATLEVRIAGTVLSLPAEMRPLLEDGKSIGFFGQTDRKADYARFCRHSGTGTRAVDVETVWIDPAASHGAMTSACNAHAPPGWCKGYSAEPYRRMGKVIIAKDAIHDFPMPYWNGGGALRRGRRGDLNDGSVCLLPDAGTRTQCWTWQPYGDGSRLTVSTSNLDQVFDGMAAEEAREMIRQAREITLAITKPE